jgi:hypothetical protein
MAQRSTLRASDEDRERIADRLRRAAAEGRIHAHELEERLAKALRARTYGELEDTVYDLPSDGVARRPRRHAGEWVQPAAALAIAIPLACVAVAIVMAVALFVLSGVFAVWMLWVAIGWFCFGHRPHPYRHRRARGGGFRRGGVGEGRAPAGGPRQFQRF